LRFVLVLVVGSDNANIIKLFCNIIISHRFDNKFISKQYLLLYSKRFRVIHFYLSMIINNLDISNLSLVNNE